MATLRLPTWAAVH